MKLRVDKQANALYLRLDDSEVVDSVEVALDVVLDYNCAEEVVGVEMLNLPTRSSALSDYLRGAAHIFDFTGSLGARTRTSQDDSPAEAAAAAIPAAWQAVGDDLYRAMGMRCMPPKS